MVIKKIFVFITDPFYLMWISSCFSVETLWNLSNFIKEFNFIFFSVKTEKFLTITTDVYFW